MTYFKFTPGSDAEVSLEDSTTGTGRPIAFNDCRQVNWLIIGAGTISGGAVVIESAHAQDYSGTWNELDNLDATTLSGGKLYGNTFPMPPGAFVRIRISSDITGGGTIEGRVNGLLG
jgi:hypothetical protein